MRRGPSRPIPAGRCQVPAGTTVYRKYATASYLREGRAPSLATTVFV